ncbi:MAG: CopD family protein [Chloroflexi bacterium]|nr:CopD family protein [Chloroflexota bacterium]
MEWVLRYAQRTMPPSQVAVVCKNAGRRYRWFGLVSVLVIGLSGLFMVLRLDDGELAARAGSPELSLGDSYGQTLLLLTAAWAVLLACVSAMAFWLHPAQAKRSRPHMTEEEVKAERARVGVAIKRMEHVLRLELVVTIVAVALGASLHVGGLW